MFQKRGEDVGMMVLDPDVRQAGPLGEPRRSKVGMEVGDEELRLGAEEPLEMGKGLLEIAEVPVIVEVAQELARDDVAVLVQGDRVLELAAEGRDHGPGPEPFRDRLRIGDIPPGPPDEEGLPSRGLDDRVVRPHLDRTVVGQDDVAEGRRCPPLRTS